MNAHPDSMRNMLAGIIYAVSSTERIKTALIDCAPGEKEVPVGTARRLASAVPGAQHLRAVLRR